MGICRGFCAAPYRAGRYRNIAAKLSLTAEKSLYSLFVINHKNKRYLLSSKLQAQRAVPDMCIVVRHIPTDQYGESLKKALSYEALKKFSVNAANLFWDKVLPQTSLGIPTPYEASLLLAFQEAAIPAEAFGEVLSKDAAGIINEDILAGLGRITSTPTYILAGIRFPSCDFTAVQLREALGIAKKAREGDKTALEEVISIITKGQLNEKML